MNNQIEVRARRCMRHDMDLTNGECPACVAEDVAKERELKPRYTPEHSPLPWRRGQAGNLRIYAADGMGSDSGSIAEIYSHSERCSANIEFIVRAVNAHEGLIEALESYEKAILALTDKQLIDNQPLMGAVVNGRAALAQAKGGE